MRIVGFACLRIRNEISDMIISYEYFKGRTNNIGTDAAVAIKIRLRNKSSMTNRVQSTLTVAVLTIGLKEIGKFDVCFVIDTFLFILKINNLYPFRLGNYGSNISREWGNCGEMIVVASVIGHCQTGHGS